MEYDVLRFSRPVHNLETEGNGKAFANTGNDVKVLVPL